METSRKLITINSNISFKHNSNRIIVLLFWLFISIQISLSQTIQMPLFKRPKQSMQITKNSDENELVTEDEAKRRGLVSYTKTMTNFRNFQYYSTLYIGADSKEMTFVYDTGSTTLWLPLEACAGCSSTNRKYTPTSTYIDSGTAATINYAQGSVSGTYATENVRLLTSLAAVNMSK
jgi:hypothetical protein